MSKLIKNFSIVALLVALLSTTANAGEPKPSATLVLDQVEISLLISGKLGDGTVNFNGKKAKFTIGGLGVGGIGISKIEATGDVFHMNSMADFAGAYVQARSGIVATKDAQLKGGIWLKNTKGVVIHLKPAREGLALSLGADAIVITFE